MKIIKVIIAGLLLSFTNILFALPQTGKFVKCEYKYILELDSQIFKSFINNSKAIELIDILNKNIQCYKLKKKDFLLVKTFIYRAKLIAQFRDIGYNNNKTGSSVDSRAKQLDLYRDYVTASAEIQARFEKKYKRIKKRKCK